MPEKRDFPKGISQRHSQAVRAQRDQTRRPGDEEDEDSEEPDDDNESTEEPDDHDRRKRPSAE